MQLYVSLGIKRRDLLEMSAYYIGTREPKRIN